MLWNVSLREEHCGNAIGDNRSALPARRAGGGVRLREVQRERAAFVRRAAETDFATEQARELAADREAKTRAAVLPAGRAVSLLKGFEDDLLFLRRDTDAGIRDGEGKNGSSAVERLVFAGPAVFNRRDLQRHLALVGE